MANSNPDTSGLKPFKKGQSGNPKGRPKRLVQKMKDKGYTKDDVRATYASIADCSQEELEDILSNKDATVLELSIAMAFLQALKKGEYKLIKDIIELFSDKPKQSLSVETKKEQGEFDEMTTKDIEKRIKQLRSGKGNTKA